MVQQADLVSIGRNLVVYLFGVGIAIVGALGMAEAIELSFVASVLLLAVGLASVVAVHEYFDGPF